MHRARQVAALAVVAAIASVSVALAASSSATSVAPVVVTLAATNVTSSTATLNGTVDPAGQATSYAFQWGPTTSYGHETPLTSAGSGSTASPVSAALSGLTAATTYHYRLIAVNGAGQQSFGSDQSFTTTGTAPAPSKAPSATTGAATDVTGTTATLSGTVNPNGQSTQYYFEYGLTSNYGFETAPVNAGSGTSNVNASAKLGNLQDNATYHYRLVAVSAGGTTLGSDATFTTQALPTVNTGRATDLGEGHVRLNGTVKPNGHATTYYFQYGPTDTYGFRTVGREITHASAGIVSVSRYVGGLTAATTYHYRIVATSSAGTSYGADQTFKTKGTSTASQVRVLGHEGFVSPGGVIGVELGCFVGSTTCDGSVKMVHSGHVIGSRRISIAPDSGGFQNMQLTGEGQRLLSRNRPFHLLAVTVEVSTTSGQELSYVIHLARWVWH